MIASGEENICEAEYITIYLEYNELYAKVQF